MPGNRDIQIRDPFVLPVASTRSYCLFGTTDPDCWKGPGSGFDEYTGTDLEHWDGPFPAFRPQPGFWGTTNFWAPEAHVYRGRHYLFATFKADGASRGTQALAAEQATGPHRVHSPEPLTPRDWGCLDGTLRMLWSSFSDTGYAMGVATSASGTVEGPWRQAERPVFLEAEERGGIVTLAGK